MPFWAAQTTDGCQSGFPLKKRISAKLPESEMQCWSCNCGLHGNYPEYGVDGLGGRQRRNPEKVFFTLTGPLVVWEGGPFSWVLVPSWSAILFEPERARRLRPCPFKAYSRNTLWFVCQGARDGAKSSAFPVRVTILFLNVGEPGGPPSQQIKRSGSRSRLGQDQDKDESVTFRTAYQLSAVNRAAIFVQIWWRLVVAPRRRRSALWYRASGADERICNRNRRDTGAAGLRSLRLEF
jgi:hypothetical protein